MNKVKISSFVYNLHMNNQLTIGQVAKQVGIPTKTIRYYEEIHLLNPANRLENKYREYSEQDIARLTLIKQARALDIPISEVRDLVKECIDGSCEHLKENLQIRLPNYIASVKERIKQLEGLKEQLETLSQNLSNMPLSNPKMKVMEKECCEVIEQIEKVTQKGGVKNGKQKKR